MTMEITSTHIWIILGAFIIQSIALWIITYLVWRSYQMKVQQKKDDDRKRDEDLRDKQD